MKKKTKQENIEYKKFSELKPGDKIYTTNVAFHKCCDPKTFEKVVVYTFVEFVKLDGIFTSVTADRHFPEDGVACRCKNLFALHNPAKLITNDNFAFADKVFLTNRPDTSVYYGGDIQQILFATPDKRLLDLYLNWQYGLFISDFKQQLKKYRQYLSDTKKNYKKTLKRLKDE